MSYTSMQDQLFKQSEVIDFTEELSIFGDVIDLEDNHWGLVVVHHASGYVAFYKGNDDREPFEVAHLIFTIK